MSNAQFFPHYCSDGTATIPGECFQLFTLTLTIIFLFSQIGVNFTVNCCTEQSVSHPTEELVKVTVRENHNDGVGFTVGKLYFPWPLDQENNIPLYIHSKLSETTFDKIITYSYLLMDKHNETKRNFENQKQ